MSAKIKTFTIKLQLIFGIGYWKDIYKKDRVGLEGLTHNLVIPFIRIQWGYLIYENLKP